MHIAVAVRANDARQPRCETRARHVARKYVVDAPRELARQERSGVPPEGLGDVVMSRDAAHEVVVEIEAAPWRSLLIRERLLRAAIGSFAMILSRAFSASASDLNKEPDRRRLLKSAQAARASGLRPRAYDRRPARRSAGQI